jgi:hypothetical protein
MIYNFELLVSIAVLFFLTYFLLRVKSETAPTLELLGRYNISFQTKKSPLTVDEMVKLKEGIDNVPVLWFRALYTMAQIFNFPLTLLNRWVYAKLTE